MSETERIFDSLTFFNVSKIVRGLLAKWNKEHKKFKEVAAKTKLKIDSVFHSTRNSCKKAIEN